ncbi:MAG: hypothetical protein EOM80_07375 [Erysipelotrichia bacterium]|nr:hypothetical protein [Erysipelotrichia bacterium]
MNWPMLHPLILSVYPVLFLYSVNAGQMRFFDAAAIALCSLCLTVSILWLILKLLKNKEKASLLVSGFCFMFFAYGAFYEMLRGMFENDSIRNFWLPIFWFAGWLFSVFVILKSRQDTSAATLFLNVLSVVLFLFLSVNIVDSYWRSCQHNSFSAGLADVKTSEAVLKRSLPDIYYIILDGYARNDVLKSLYGYDNRGFIDFLAKSGFRVASESCSNYCQTYLSLASSLNFSYLDHLQREYRDVNNDQPLIEMIAKNQVFATLKKNGYKTIAFSSGYTGTELREADIYFSRSMLSREFIDLLLNSTYLSAMKFSFFDAAETRADVHRERIKDVFNLLGSFDLPPEPVVLFAHVLCPHPPFVFGPAGEKRRLTERFNYSDGSHWGSDSEKYRRQYRDQLVYINSLLQQSIGRLLADTAREKIIILQSDHGPGSGLKWQDPDATDLFERMSVFYAVYFADADYRYFYDSITPVNTFRIIFNRLFNAELPLLDDKSYFSPWFGRYRFVDVTSKVKR